MTERQDERICSREPEDPNGWQECHHCECLWGPLLHKTGWRPEACPERIRVVGDLAVAEQEPTK